MSTASLHPTALAVQPANTCATPGAALVRPCSDQSAAVELDQAPADLADLAALAPDAAAAYARGWWVIPLRPGSKVPALRKDHPALLGQRRLSARELAYHARRGCNFGVMLDPSGLALVDVEAEGDAGPWAAHAAGGPNVVTTWSGGAHAYYSRPAGTPARRVIKVKGADGQRLAVDVLSKGYAVLAGSVVKDPNKAPFSGSYTAPAAFWSVELPTAPADVLAALAEPEPPTRPDPPAGPSAPVSTSRAERFIVGLVERWARRIGPMQPGTGRRRAAYAAARAAGEYLHNAPHLEPWVIQTLTSAAHACRLVETDTERGALANITNGLGDGKAAPRNIPDRAGWHAARMRGQALPADLAEVAPVQAAALACLATLGQRVRGLVDDDGKAIHHRTAVTVELVAGEVLRRMAETGGPVVEAVAVLGLAIDRGGASVWRALPWLVRLGLDVDHGAPVGREGGQASRFTLSKALLCQNEIGARATLQTTSARQRPKGTEPDNVHFVLTEEENEHAAALVLASVAAAGEDLSRGLRRALDDAALQALATRENSEGGRTLAPTGDYTPAALAAVQAAGDDGLTYAELAAALGCSESTARRIGPRMVDRGAWIERARISEAGRRLVVFVATVTSSRILEIVRAVGARVRRWAEGRIEAGREIRRKAEDLVNGGYFGTAAAALVELRRRARERARAERDAVTPGGERGRPGWDREGAGRALANAAAWAKHNAETAGVMS